MITTLQERLERVIERQGERFIARVFSDEERAYCGSMKHPFKHYAARFAATLGIKIYTIGVGTPGLHLIRLPNGGVINSHRDEFDEESLKRIAEIGSGMFFKAQDSATLKRVFDAIVGSVQRQQGRVITTAAEGGALLDDWCLPEAEAIPIALSLNELLGNALHHGHGATRPKARIADCHAGAHPLALDNQPRVQVNGQWHRLAHRDVGRIATVKPQWRDIQFDTKWSRHCWGRQPAGNHNL